MLLLSTQTYIEQKTKGSGPSLSKDRNGRNAVVLIEARPTQSIKPFSVSPSLLLLSEEECTFEEDEDGERERERVKASIKSPPLNSMLPNLRRDFTL